MYMYHLQTLVPQIVYNAIPKVLQVYPWPLDHGFFVWHSVILYCISEE